MIRGEKMKYKILIRKENNRLRAYLYDETGRKIACWWIESTDHKRYKPFKPLPPLAHYIINQLPTEKIQKLANFLIMAREGDTFEFEITS